jgi:hypothetical protein
MQVRNLIEGHPGRHLPTKLVEALGEYDLKAMPMTKRELQERDAKKAEDTEAAEPGPRRPPRPRRTRGTRRTRRTRRTTRTRRTRRTRMSEQDQAMSTGGRGGCEGEDCSDGTCALCRLAEFPYLMDMSDRDLRAELAHAKEHGLTGLVVAAEWETRRRDRGRDFCFVGFGNIYDEPEEPDDERAEVGEPPRCDAEITPVDGDASYAATHCGRVEGHAPEKRSGRVEHQSYAALARKRKGSIRADKSNGFHENVDLPKSEFAPGDHVFHPVYGQGHVTRNDGGRIRVMWRGIGGTMHDEAEGRVDHE